MNGESKSFFTQRPSLEVFATPMIYSLTILKGFLLQQLSLNVLSRSSSDFPLYTPCACFWTKNSFDKESLREWETTLLTILITASKWLLFFLIETVFILRSRLTFCFGNIPEVYGSISVSLELHRSLCLCSELLAGTQNQKVETLHFFWSF